MESQDNKNQKRHDSSDKSKELKKIQKVQQKAQALLRDEKQQSKKEKKGQKEKKDNSKIKKEKVIKALKSFIKIFQDDLEEFFDLFAQLDDGCVIETGGIENQNIKQKLDKLMNKLKLKNQGDEKAPIFKKIDKNIKLESFIRGLYDEVFKGIKYQEPESSNSNFSKSESPEKMKEVIKNTEPQKQLQKRQEEKSDMDLFLEKNFAQGGDRKLTSYLNERKKVQNQPIQQQQVKSDGLYLGEVTQKQRNPEEIKEFMIWYDQEFRSKSLAEEHREKLERERLEKMKARGVQQNQRGGTNVRKEFNRDTDMNMSTQTSSEFIARIRQSGSLNQKFSSGHLQNQFI